MVECVAAPVQQRRDLDERLPLHEQHHIQAAMHSFHAEMSSIEIPTCSTCTETFPGMKINSRTSECLVTGVSPNCIPLPTTCTQVQYQQNYRLDYKVVLFDKLTMIFMK